MGRCGPGPGRRGRSGVTLPELLVVIAIIALTLLVVVPTFGNLRGPGALRAGARELSAALREARRLAIANRDSYAVVIDCNAFSSSAPTADPVTRYWIAQVDLTFDPLTPAGTGDATDVAHSGGPAPFDGEFTTLDPVGDPQELPRNVVVVAAMIDSQAYQGSDFTPVLRLNALRTEDANMDNALVAAEDLGVDGFNQGNGAPIGEPEVGTDPVDPGEDDLIISTVYRVIRFGPQGNADRTILWLWNTTDGGAPLPDNVAPNAPRSLRLLGLPPGLTVQDAADQRNYFTVSDQAQDAHYYTLMVNPSTGATEVFDYARGTATAGPPADWDLDKDGGA